MVSTQERRHTLIGFARILILKDSMLDNFIQQFQQQLSEQQQQHQQPDQEKRKFLTIAVRIYVLWHRPIQFNPIIHHLIFKWPSNENIFLGDPKNSKALNIKDGVTVACNGNTCDLRCPAGLKPSFNRQLKCVVTKRRKELFEIARSLSVNILIAFSINQRGFYSTFQRLGNQRKSKRVFIVFLMVVTKIHQILLPHRDPLLVVVLEVVPIMLLLGLILHQKVRLGPNIPIPVKIR